MTARDKRSSAQPSSHHVPKMLTWMEATGKEIGEGAYGKVVELRDRRSGKIYAAKQISNLDTKYRTEHQFIKKYEDFAKLRHPNLVEFYGFYKTQRGLTMPSLVMERMDENLTLFIEGSPNIQMACKLTILVGVAEGLKYLHSQSPPIVHGRLTSNNILLNHQEGAIQAKIGDVGISIMTTPIFKPAIASCRDNARSTADFLPPAAQRLQQKGFPCLDIFSYGKVMLHTMTQEWPNPRQRQPLAKIKEERVEIVKLIEFCVDEKHEQRPPIVTVLTTVQKLCNEISSKSDEKLNLEDQAIASNKTSDLEKEEALKAAAAAVNENKMLKQALKEVHNNN